MKFKKLVSTALAGAMALSLSVPAFASGNTDTSLSQSTDITGSTQAPTIKITVPAAGTVTVNPYKMAVSVGGSDVTDQIISATQFIENASDVALKVSAEMTGTAAGNLAFATASTQGSRAPTTNSVFMYFEMVASDDGSTEPTWATAYDSKATTQILVSTKATKKADMLTLAAGTGTAAASAGGYAAFHLAGDAASTPTTAWAAADKADVAIAFTFTPTATPTATP